MKNEVKSFFARPTNIAILIAAASVLLIVFGCLLKGNAQSILISFGANLITSILLFFLIDKRIDEGKRIADEETKRKKEKKQILKHHMSLELKLKELFVHYNQLIIPYDERVQDHTFLPIRDDGFEDLDHISQLVDMFNTSITIYGQFGETCLTAFKRTHDKISELFRMFLIEVDFECYPEVKKTLDNLMKILSSPNCMEALENFSRDKKVISVMREMMKDYSGNLQEDITVRKYSGNLFLQPLTLCYYLNAFATAVNAYISEISKLK